MTTEAFAAIRDIYDEHETERRHLAEVFANALHDRKPFSPMANPYAARHIMWIAGRIGKRKVAPQRKGVDA